jgi:hypothetical protein
MLEGGALAGGSQVGRAGTDWSIAGAGDFNGDGTDDILWRHQNGQVAVWELEDAKSVDGGIVGNAATAWDIENSGGVDEFLF